MRIHLLYTTDLTKPHKDLLKYRPHFFFCVLYNFVVVVNSGHFEHKQGYQLNKFLYIFNCFLMNTSYTYNINDKYCWLNKKEDEKEKKEHNDNFVFIKARVL